MDALRAFLDNLGSLVSDDPLDRGVLILALAALPLLALVGRGGRALAGWLVRPFRRAPAPEFEPGLRSQPALLESPVLERVLVSIDAPKGQRVVVSIGGDASAGRPPPPVPVSGLPVREQAREAELERLARHGRVPGNEQRSA